MREMSNVLCVTGAEGQPSLAESTQTEEEKRAWKSSMASIRSSPPKREDVLPREATLRTTDTNPSPPNRSSSRKFRAESSEEDAQGKADGQSSPQSVMASGGSQARRRPGGKHSPVSLGFSPYPGSAPTTRPRVTPQRSTKRSSVPENPSPLTLPSPIFSTQKVVGAETNSAPEAADTQTAEQPRYNLRARNTNNEA